MAKESKKARAKIKEVAKHLKSDMKTFEHEKKDDKKLLKKLKRK